MSLYAVFNSNDAGSDRNQPKTNRPVDKDKPNLLSLALAPVPRKKHHQPAATHQSKQQQYQQHLHHQQVIDSGDTGVLRGRTISAGLSDPSTAGGISASSSSTRKRVAEEYNPDRPNEYEDVKERARQQRRERRRLEHTGGNIDKGEDVRQVDVTRFSERTDHATLPSTAPANTPLPAAVPPTVHPDRLRMLMLAETKDEEETGIEEKYLHQKEERRLDEEDDEEDDDDVDGVPLVRPVSSESLESLATTEQSDDKCEDDDEDVDGVPMVVSGNSLTQQEQKPQYQQRHAQELQPKSSNPSSSTIVLLTNLVGPGEVDEELQVETAEECARFGTVLKCIVHEYTRPGTRAEEAVRVFVKFQDAGAAMKAKSEMDRRFFGGRVISATFFDEDKFSKNELD